MTKLFRNNGDSTFSEVPVGLVSVEYCSVAWDDYNSDGRLDILIAGRDASRNRVTKIYRNNGNGNFSDIGAGLAGVSSGSVAWGDYDNDGRLDVLLTGEYFNGSYADYVTRICHNDGNDRFTEIAAGLTGVSDGSAAWGDYDNDGRLDVVLTGMNGTHGGSAGVWHNNGGNVFAWVDSGIQDASPDSRVAWGDYDNDGRLDIAYTGRYAGTICRNNGPAVNSAPAAPTGLRAASLSMTSANLSWIAPADSQTPAPGLSYNLRVGTTPGASDVVAPAADTSTGFRRLAERGMVQGTSWTLEKLAPARTYYWSVQAVDTGLMGSPFGAEGSFTTLPLFIDQGSLGLDDVSSNAVAWGDYNSDGWMDVLLAGNTGTAYIARIYRNNGDNSFSDIHAGLAGIAEGSAAWGDYDNDGRLDILLTGTNDCSEFITKIYHNNGGDSFTEVAAALPGVTASAAAWGDYDNDGRLDILLAGKDRLSIPVAKLFHNDGNDTFVEIAAGLTGVMGSAAAWGDFDSDGRLDILLAGLSSEGPIAKIYRNNGDSTFTDIRAGLAGVDTASAAWGDYDNDGRLDLLLAGPAMGRAAIYHNNGANSFTYLGIGSVSDRYRHAAWGDYDNDGRLDVVLTGVDDTGANAITDVLHNDGGHTFTKVVSGVNGSGDGRALWGDYNNDGRLDILVAGRPGGTRLYRNGALVTNSAPAPPATLTANVLSSTSVTLTWSAGTDGVQTPAAGLGYNLRVGTTPGASDVVGPMADAASGVRRLAERGPIQGTSWTLDDLSAARTYFWTVQTVDSGFMGSPFSAEGSFTTVADNVGRIRGTVWDDRDNDGTGDGGEPGLSGWAVFLDGDGDAQLDAGEPWTATDLRGAYEFDSLVPGEYKVAQAAEAGWVRTFPNTTYGIHTVSVAPGMAYQVDFGDYLPPSFIDGWVWNDIDGNGRWDAAEPGLAGWSVYLDANGDHSPQGSETRTTDANGHYRFDNLTFGTHNIGQLSRPDWACSFPAGSSGYREVTLNPGWGAFDVNFGNRQPEIRGDVWDDLDGDGIRDAGEPGLTGRTVFLDGNGDGVLNTNEKSATTNAGGEYAIVGVSDGTYSVVQVQEGGWLQTLPPAPEGHAVTITAAQTATGIDFGNWRAPFRDMGSLGLPGVPSDAVAWGDYDDDGRPDLVLAGNVFTPQGTYTPVARVYRNEGNGSFSDIGAGLAGASYGAVAWGDYDNDGRLDILLTGSPGGSELSFTKVYHNEGNGRFTDIGVSLSGVVQGSATWGDYDNDGRLDILLAGRMAISSTSEVAKVYHNDGDGRFTEIAAGLTGACYGAAAWGDYDNDGRLDILLTGGIENGHGYVAKIYHNDGNGRFTEIAAGLTGVWHSAAAWGDYDNDGWLDILLTGQSHSGYIAKVYHNNGDSTFSDIAATLPGILNGSAAWGDYNNDGRLDILLAGHSSYGKTSAVYQNDGNGRFRQIVYLGAYYCAKWGDYDGDGRLDVIVPAAYYSPPARIWRNVVPTANSAPAAPTNLAVSALSLTSVALSWGASSDAQTPTNGLSYNLRVGTTPGGSDVVSPMADASSGARRLLQRGMTQGTSWTHSGLSVHKRYYWSVQAVDTGFAGSPFAAEGSFTTIGDSTGAIGGGVWNDEDGDGVWDAGEPALSGWTLFLDGDGDGQLDAGEPSTTSDAGGQYAFVNLVPGEYKVAQVAQGGWAPTFPTTPSGVHTVTVNAGQLVWPVDFGGNVPPSEISGWVWKDADENGQWDAGEPGLAGWTVYLDANGNGRLDSNEASAATDAAGHYSFPDVPLGTRSVAEVVQIGWKRTFPTGTGIQQVVVNPGQSVPNVNFGNYFFPGEIRGSVWNDLDTDGTWDAGEPGLAGWTVFVDADGDGALDSDEASATTNASGEYAMVGVADGTYSVVQVPQADWRQTFPAAPGRQTVTVASGQTVAGVHFGNWAIPFSDQGSLGLMALEEGSVAWGDYDNDGHMDVLLTGRQASDQRLAKVYRNNGDNTFTEIPAGLIGVAWGSAAWGDYDNDGRPDILLTGATGADHSYQAIAKIYRNNGDGTFADIGAGLPGVIGSAVAWGDYDNDGRLDILLSGGNGATRIVRIYRNNGDGTFREINAGLTGAAGGSAAWGDYNNDGWLDILLTGQTDAIPSYLMTTKVYRNNADGTFADIDAAFAGTAYGSSVWGDYDNDGRLDILLSGSAGRIYHNDGDGHFTDIGVQLPPVAACSAAWGDYDNDGRLDLVMGGMDDSEYPQPIAKLYHNEGGNVFAEIPAGLAPFFNGSVTWRDYDNDGRLDLLMVGCDSSTLKARFYRNLSQQANTSPAEPTGLAASGLSPTSAVLSWSAPVDAQTPASGLSYNLRVAATPGTGGASSAMRLMAEPATVYRRVAGLGTVEGTSWTVTNLAPGLTYYWSVQAVDGGLAGSAFAEGSFTASEGTPLVIPASDRDDVIVVSSNATTHTVTVNGIPNTYDATVWPHIRIDGLAGNDQVTVTGSTLTDTATLGYRQGAVAGPGYRVSFGNAKKIKAIASGGAAQTAYLDQAAGNDKFYCMPGIAYMLYQDGSESRVYGFRRVEARASLTDGDQDCAYFYDSSGNDTYSGSPGASSMLLADGTEHVATGFERVYASSNTSPGGTDTALINDSAGNDRFYYYGASATGYVWYPGGGLNYTSGFDRVEAVATTSGDMAVLNDSSANDRYEAWIDRVELRKIGGGYENVIHGFKTVYAYSTSTAGEADQACFHDGSGNDRFIAGCGAPNDSYMSYETGQVVWGRGFELVEGTAAGGMDQAWLFDSPGNDVYTVMQGGVNEAAMLPAEGAAYSRKAVGFDKYYGYSTAGGTDQAHLYDSPGNDTLTAKPIDVKLAYISGPMAGMELRAYLFEQVVAHATLASGDADTALFYDDAGSSDLFTANQNQAELKRTTIGSWAYDNMATGFDMVYAWATASTASNDLAEITDSVLNDYLYTNGKTNEAYIRYGSAASTNQTYAKGFDRVTLKAITGGRDTVTMTDSAANDTFTGDRDWAQMVNDLATYFFRVEGLSGGQATGDRVFIRSDYGFPPGGVDREHREATVDYVFAIGSGTWTSY